MHRGWIQLGQTEVANAARAVTYMRSGVINSSLRVVTDDSWPLLPTFLGRESEWTRPEWDDDCPWRDPAESASSEFAGVWPMSIEGLDVTPVEREVVEGATVGGGFGVTRIPPREINFEAVLVGSTPAGLRYGLDWLSGVLRGDRCEDGDSPRDLLYLNAAPPYDARLSRGEVARLGAAESRMVSSVALTKGLQIEETFAPWSWEQRGACAARVSWSMTAGVPWVWRLPTPIVSGLRPADGVEETVTFENVGPDGVCPSGCAETSRVLVDPEGPPLAVLPRPVTPAAAAACSPIRSKRLRWVLHAGVLGRFAETVPTVTVRTGDQPERKIRLQWVEGIAHTEEDISCASIGEVMIGYLPARSVCTLDAVTGTATVTTSDGQSLDATPVMTGRHGGPWRPPVLRCGGAYTVFIDAEASVSRAVTVDIDGVVRQP